jgi:hypothetical protein
MYSRLNSLDTLRAIAISVSVRLSSHSTATHTGLYDCLEHRTTVYEVENLILEAITNCTRSPITVGSGHDIRSKV